MALSSTTIDMPAGAQRGATLEAKSAHDQASQTERDTAIKTLSDALGPVEQYLKPKLAPQTRLMPMFPGLARLVAPHAPTNAPLGFVTQSMRIQPAATPSDADNDQLSDAFEQAVADAFTPNYHVSAGEPDAFALFKDQPTLAVAQLRSATPPVSHFRVAPLLIATGRDGVRYGFLQIDYLTVWNHDSGLAISKTCRVLSAGLGITLDGLFAHDFDEERSAVLAYAPLEGNNYSTSVSAYRALDYYCAAHEGVVIFDHSDYYEPREPLPPNTHVDLGLSFSKHGTYPFNPNKFPIFRPEIIFIVFATIETLYVQGRLNLLKYLLLLYGAYTLFFECVVERFTDQGGVLATTRLNVGKPRKPLNSCSWINDERIRRKLESLWVLQ